METRANYVLIGAFTLAVAALGLVFGLWAGKFASDRSWNEYVIRFTQSVTGVSVGSPVLYNGINVGKIIDLELNLQDLREVIVTIQVDADIPLHEDTEAGLRILGVTGMAAIQLSGGAPGMPLLDREPGQGLPEIPARESALLQILESSEGMFVTANNILLQMQKLLNDSNIKQVSETLASLQVVSATMAEQREEFARLVQQSEQASARINGLLASADGTFTQAGQFISEFDERVSAALPGIIQALDESLENIASVSVRANAIMASNQEALMGVGSEGLNQIGPGLEELRALIRELSVIAENLGQNPAEFLLGSDTAEEYQP